MYTLEELEEYKVKQLKALADYEGKAYPKRVTKGQLIDLLVQLPLPEIKENGQPCSVRIHRIRQSKEN